jgi:hypothetical protein
MPSGPAIAGLDTWGTGAMTRTWKPSGGLTLLHFRVLCEEPRGVRGRWGGGWRWLLLWIRRNAVSCVREYHMQGLVASALLGPAYVHAYECVWCGDVGNGSRSRGSEGPGGVLVVERVESEWNSRWGTLSGRVGERVGRV